MKGIKVVMSHIILICAYCLLVSWCKAPESNVTCVIKIAMFWVAMSYDLIGGVEDTALYSGFKLPRRCISVSSQIFCWYNGVECAVSAVVPKSYNHYLECY